jgi:hypothetical protein
MGRARRNRGCARSSRFAVLDGKPLPLARPNPQRIPIFGDTGCRILARIAQECNDPQAWPFPKIAVTAAAARPDLVIHIRRVGGRGLRRVS